MIEIKQIEFEGHETLRISNGVTSLWVTISVGPRVLGFSAFGGENLLAILPDLVLDYPGEGDLHLYGGHRLWYAPEIRENTYIPDSQPVQVERIEGRVKLIQPVDEPTWIQKSLQITMHENNPEVTIVHRLQNRGAEAFNLAPWAITQVKPGGICVVPQKASNQDVDGLLPNRNVVLWPYTSIRSEHLFISDEAIYVKAEMTEGALKIGIPNPDGWITYLLGDQLFTKQAEYIEGADYLDRGASTQIYCCPEFIELETLGPEIALQPGGEVSHTEKWRIDKTDGITEKAKRLLKDYLP